MEGNGTTREFIRNYSRFGSKLIRKHFCTSAILKAAEVDRLRLDQQRFRFRGLKVCRKLLNY